MTTVFRPRSADTSGDPENIYVCGYSSASVQIMASRTAEVHARFLLPYLQPGMRLVDLGCGPGSITVGLAKIVAPGEVVGIDIESTQIGLARAHAAEQAVTNARFEIGDVRQLSVPDSAFDVVFGHTILMQFQDPIPVLSEVQRILQPGGVVGFREPCFVSNLSEPPDSAQDQLWKLFGRALAYNGGDIDIGRRLGALLGSTGFGRLAMSASFSGAWTPEAKHDSCERYARLCEEADFMKQAIGLGWIGPDAAATMVRALRAEGEDPAAFFATAWREIVGWKLA
jgi:SAM-dependent methyltransferase